MVREKALKLKAICYSKPFISKFGDWLSVGNEFMRLSEKERTEKQLNLLLIKHKVIIELDQGFEPILNEEILRFILSEDERIFEGDGELEL